MAHPSPIRLVTRYPEPGRTAKQLRLSRKDVVQVKRIVERVARTNGKTPRKVRAKA